MINANVFTEIPIEHLCTRVTTGATPLRSRRDYYESGTIDWYKTGELKDWYLEPATERITEKALKETSAKLFPANTVLMAMYGDGRTITNMGMLRSPAATNQACSAMLVDEAKCDTRFFFYALKNRRHLLLKVASGGAQRNLSGKLVKEFTLPIPPLPVQRRIASILSGYDDLIENNLRRIAILEEMARAVYREWFIEFKFPGYAKTPRCTSEIGSVPKDWAIRSIGDVADVFRGRSYGSNDLADEGGLPFVNLKCIDRDGGFRRTGLKRYTGKYKDAHRVRKGDIVMGVTDMTQERRIVARAALVPTLDHECGVFSMDLVRIEPKPPVAKLFLYCFFRFSDFADEVKQHANGANVLHLSPDRISGFRFGIPPTALMSRFADFVGPLLELVDALQNRTDNLRHTRDLLLPKLLSHETNLE